MQTLVALGSFFTGIPLRLELMIVSGIRFQIQFPFYNFRKVIVGSIPMIEARSGLALVRNFMLLAKQLFFFVVDFSMLVLAMITAYQAYRYLEIGKQVQYSIPNFLLTAAYISGITILVLILSGAYQCKTSLLNVEETRRFVKGISFSALLISVGLVFLKIQLSRYVLVFSYVLSVFFVVIEKLILYHILPKTRYFSWMNRRILIYGAGSLGQRLYRAIANSPKLDIHPVGFIDDNPESHKIAINSGGYKHVASSLSVLGTGADLSALIKKLNIAEVFVAISDIDSDKLSSIRKRALAENVRVSFVPNLHHHLLHKVNIRTIAQIPLVQETEDAPLFIYTFIKRIMDLFLALLLLIPLLPLGLLIMLAIKLDSKGPIFFPQIRVGLNGKRFRMIKFRSMMIESNPYAPSPSSSRDERVTRVGRWLRKTSLDELPQIINIIKGEMSFVGPRPEMPFIVEKYNDLEKERLKVLPGITGLWQLSADRNRAIHENMDYDLHYVAHRSIFLDIAIMIETLFFAFRGN